MLMHGEDTNVAELRPPAIKGAMRFWWRAIHGNFNNPEKLKQEESKIFGGAGDEKNAIKSSFRIKLSKLSPSTQIDPLPHKPKKHNGDPKFTISGFKSGNFEIQFIGKELEKIEKIFELTTILGGFGQRSRRGFGSVQIQNKNEITDAYITQLITKINPNFSYTSSIHYPYIKSIDIGQQYDKVDDLLKTISSATHHHNGDGIFGSVKNGRYASPIYISVIQDQNNYRPIITILNATKQIDEKRLNAFKGAIL